MNINNLLEFEDEQSVKERMNIQIIEILNEKQNLQPAKIQSLIKQYQKHNELESNKIKIDISSKIQNLEYVQTFIAESQTSYQQMQGNFKEMQEYYQQNEKRILELDEVNKLLVFRHNLQKIIEQMKYFMNMKKKIMKIKQLLQQNDLSDYEYINFKLMKLMILKENLQKGQSQSIETEFQNLKLSTMFSNQSNENINTTQNKLKESMTQSSYQKDDVLQQDLEELKLLNEQFLQRLEEQFANLLDSKSLKNVQIIQKIIESADQTIQFNLNNDITIYPQNYFINTFKKIIEETIQNKFTQNYKKIDQSDLGLIISNSEFIIQDMVRVLKYIEPGFYQKNNIFQFIQNIYKDKLIKIVEICLSDEQNVKESYGNLLALLQFIDNYEKYLERQSSKQDNIQFTELKVLVKQYMPQFLEHLENLLSNQITKYSMEDKQKDQKLEQIKQKIEQDEEVMSNIPVDTFKVINSQLEIVGDKLEGELFMEFIRIIQQQLQILVEETRIQIQEESQYYYTQLLIQKNTNSDFEYPISPIFKLVMFINNAYKYLQFSSQTKQMCLQLQPQYTNRIEHIFLHEINKQFNKLVGYSMESMQVFVFMEVELQIFPFLFSQVWLDEQLLEIAINTIDDYMKDLSNTLISIIHHNKIMKISLEYLINRYWQSLIQQSQKALNICTTYKIESPLLTQNTPPSAQIVTVLTDRKQIITKMEQEILFFQNKLASYDFINQTYSEQLLSGLSLLITMLKCSKIEIESMFGNLYKVFIENQISIYILEIVLQIRDDCDRYFSTSIQKKYKSYMERQLDTV